MEPLESVLPAPSGAGRRAQPPAFVELVDETGAAVGCTTVEEAHSGAGALHRAFSAFVFDDAGRLLLQRRALTKSRFAGLWSNTCCSHPEADAVERCATERMRDELGLATADLTRCGAVVYRAADPGSRYVEHEYDHVLVGRALDDPADPDPAEVAEWRWIEPLALAAELERAPGRFTPWFPLTLPAAMAGARSAGLADPGPKFGH
jgi:isopentenyl-diphosphate Delta-isomerase